MNKCENNAAGLLSMTSKMNLVNNV